MIPYEVVHVQISIHHLYTSLHTCCVFFGLEYIYINFLRGGLSLDAKPRPEGRVGLQPVKIRSCLPALHDPAFDLGRPETQELKAQVARHMAKVPVAHVIQGPFARPPACSDEYMFIFLLCI